MPVLYDVREEKFAQLIVRGAKPGEAKVEAGYHKQRPVKSLLGEPRISDRIKELMERAANKAVLSRTDILKRVAEDWDAARSLGQMSAALKAAEMVGKELHKMFVDRKEIGNAGEFDTKSEDELRDYITKELGLAPKQVRPAPPESPPQDISSENSIDGIEAAPPASDAIN